MPGLDRVLNFSFAHFYLRREDNSIPPEEEYWRKVVEQLYVHMPHLKTVNHISPLPQTRAFCEYALAPLPGNVKVESFGREGDALSNKPWTDWKASIVKALEKCEHRPEICGWKLTSEFIVPDGLSLLFDNS